MLPCELNAQASNEYLGKWKVVAVNNGVYYNYKTDSSYVTKNFLNTLVGKPDSVETIAMFRSFASQYADYFFTFGSDGKYEELKNGAARVFGTFKVNSSNQNIDVMYGNAGKQHPGNFKFKFEKGNLILFIHNALMEDDLELTLERP